MAQLPRAASPAAAALCVVPLLCVPAGAAPSAAPQRFQKADSGARIVAEKRVGGRARDLTVSTPNLDTRVKVRVLLPKGWRKDSGRTWPVLYAYHGGRDNYLSWTRETKIEQWAAKYGVIVVMPEAANSSYTDWFNRGEWGNPRWETFHTADVVQLVERNYRAGKRRAAIGVSAGGMGALNYAARHRGLFAFVASLSGPLWLTGPGVQASTAVTAAINGQDAWDIYGDPVQDKANWERHDPYHLAPKLRGTGIFFSAGTTGKPGPGDPAAGPLDVGLTGELAVGATNKAFRKRLKELKIPFTADLYGDGRHNWPAWRRVGKDLWPRLMKSIGARKAG
ncbi:alpha/beta hydrolase family protein [Actinocorallia aurea]